MHSIENRRSFKWRMPRLGRERIPAEHRLGRAGIGTIVDGEATKQLGFRLPVSLIEDINHCVGHLQSLGLELTRADVVRLLLRRALDETGCEVQRLLQRPRKRKHA